MGDIMTLNRAPKPEPHKMTLEELAAYPSYSVPPRIAAIFLDCTPYALNVTAREGRLTLAHYFTGNRLHISKKAILDYCGYTGPVAAGDESVVNYQAYKNGEHPRWLK